MDLVHSDENTVEFVDNAAMSFMTLLVHELNSTLASNGVESSDKRQEICYGFLFNLAYQLDAGWFIEGERKLFPKVCFGERAEPGEDENLGALVRLHVPTQASSWHEYAAGVASEYFEDNEEADPDIRTGSYDIEN